MTMNEAKGQGINDGPDLAERCRAIDMLLMDVDGVLTDGRIVYTEDGNEIKAFHVRDGSALKIWLSLQKRAGIITGRQSQLVSRRARELGVEPVIQGAADKLSALRKIERETKIPVQRTCFIGDDLPDLPVLLHCGLAVAPADACAEVREAAHFITRAPGGEGVVRETIELLLGEQGVWRKIVAGYHGQTAT